MQGLATVLHPTHCHRALLGLCAGALTVPAMAEGPGAFGSPDIACFAQLKFLAV